MGEEIKKRLNKESHEYGRLNKLIIDIDKNRPIQAHDYMIIESPNFKGKILDVGSGHCILAIVAKLKNPELDISCMEGSAINVLFGNLFTNKCKVDIDITHATIEEHPYKAKSFDTIILNHIIEHIKDLDMIFDKCEEMLKDGGTMLIAVPYLSAHWSPNHVHFFDIEDKHPEATNIVKFFEKRKYKADIIIFDESKTDPRHPYDSRGQLDMYIEVKK